ncbi:MAG TPA: pitrilysin family protein [Blastocatellia bacterium]|jgi:predicted Zn-dependent peptidase
MVKRRIIFILLAAALLAGAFKAAPARSFKVEFRQFQLENGLRVVLSEDHSAPVVAVAVYYDVGSRNEVKGRTGFAHLFEHMMFQGSENVGKAEHFKYVESNGGTLQGTTHADYTNYYEFLPSNKLELALWLESDRMRGLRITTENLQNQKEAVKEEKRSSYDNQPYWPHLLKMDEMVFRNWANSHTPIGEMRDLDAATVEEVQAFFNTYYVPNNAVLAIAGDFVADQAESLVRKYFGTIPRRDRPPSIDVSEPEGVAVRKAVVEDRLAEMPALAIAWKIPPRRSKDSYAIALLQALLFDGESARVYRKLVKELAVSLEVTATLEERRGPGQLALFTIHRPEVSAERVRAIIEGEIERIKKDGVRADELLKVKNQYRLGYFIDEDRGEQASLPTPLGRALALAEFTLFDNDPSLINTEVDRYLAVTADEMREAARNYFVDLNTAVLIINPAQQK